MIETIRDLTATSALSKPMEGSVYTRRIKGGVLGDGVNSLAAAFNIFPNTTFSQSNGVIQMTEVRSRYVGYCVAAIFALLGLLPIVGDIFRLFRNRFWRVPPLFCLERSLLQALILLPQCRSIAAP